MFWSLTSVNVTFPSKEKPNPPLANSKSTRPVASAMAVTLALPCLPDDAITLKVSPIWLSLPPNVIVMSDNEPVTIGMSSVFPSTDFVIISPLRKLPLKFERVRTCTLTLFNNFVDILSTNALAPLVPPRISIPWSDISLSKSLAYTSTYLGRLNSDADGFNTSSLG